MSAIDVEYLRFEFPSNWSVVKWDDEAAYRNGIQKLTGTKAVDLIARCERVSYFIEVKDFRGTHDLANRLRGGLLDEVACKVRDTLAGVIGAHCSRVHQDCWREHVDAWRARDEIRVIFWLEDDAPLPTGPRTQEDRRKAEYATRTDELKGKLRWLTTKVSIASQDLGSALPGVKVSNLPGATRVGARSARKKG